VNQRGANETEHAQRCKHEQGPSPGKRRQHVAQRSRWSRLAEQANVFAHVLRSSSRKRPQVTHELLELALEINVSRGHLSSTPRVVSALGSGELEAALGRLSAAEREVVALRVLLELDGPTVARVLGISTTACSTRLSRALKRLEEMMSDARD
jgi:DNA-directed RNA polymerase specialized sigma24 family protein